MKYFSIEMVYDVTINKSTSITGGVNADNVKTTRVLSSTIEANTNVSDMNLFINAKTGALSIATGLTGTPGYVKGSGVAGQSETGYALVNDWIHLGILAPRHRKTTCAITGQILLWHCFQ
jgi:hypothetical protein